MSTTTPRSADITTDGAAAEVVPLGREPFAGRVPVLLSRLWRDRRLAVASALAAPVALGVIVGLLSPRGPATTGPTLTLMALAAAAGVSAGVLLASRWAVLLAPAVHAAALEVVRLPVHGPTVDGISVAGWPQIGALLFGRGWYGLVFLLPMAVAAANGAAIARRMRGVEPRPGRRRAVGWFLRRASFWLATAGVVVLAALIARPASTAPITGPGGAPLAGSIAEMVTIDVNATEQALLIRGHSTANPVLLYLVGGPGGSQLGHVRATMEPLEEDFVLAVWEQRGAGKSYAALDPADTHTLAGAVADTIAVAEHLRERFDAERIYLMGNSWGTIPGTLAAQQRPELFHAYIGTAQMVSLTETDRRFHADLLACAERTGDTALAERMRSYGEPPYADVVAGQAVAIDYANLLMPDIDIGLPGIEGIGASEYNLVDKRNVFAGLLDTYAVMYPQLSQLDFRRDIARLDLPVYVVQGALEAPGRDDLAREWFEALAAPSKYLFTLDGAAHNPSYQAPEAFREVMREVVAETGGRPWSGARATASRTRHTQDPSMFAGVGRPPLAPVCRDRRRRGCRARGPSGRLAALRTVRFSGSPVSGVRPDPQECGHVPAIGDGL